MCVEDFILLFFVSFLPSLSSQHNSYVYHNWPFVYTPVIFSVSISYVPLSIFLNFLVSPFNFPPPLSNFNPINPTFLSFFPFHQFRQFLFQAPSPHLNNNPFAELGARGPKKTLTHKYCTILAFLYVPLLVSLFFPCLP